MIQLDHSHADDFLEKEKWERLLPRIVAAHDALLAGTGAGNEWLGWRRILLDPNDALLEEIASTADEIRSRADAVVCIGIGGSYLGAKAVIQARSSFFPPSRDANGAAVGPEILFAGHHMSGAYLRELLEYLDGRSVYAIVVSKSGTTLEPAISFRFVRQWMESHYPDAARRTTAITDPKKGALHELAGQKGYRRFVIPLDIGGRFSVLTPCGLLPIAVAGVDIRSLFYGAVAMLNELKSSDGNQALAYAGIRYALLQRGYGVEVMAHFDPRLSGMAAWWQQLFGESEGKNHTGIFPAVASYSTDLHSFGQYIQDGKRQVLETFLMASGEAEVSIPPDPGDLDGLNYLAGKSLLHANESAYKGTAQAHLDGGVPNMTLRLDALSEENLGRSIYFFQHAVAVGGYLLGINPFDQPGVEAYKKEMFSLLGKP